MTLEICVCLYGVCVCVCVRVCTCVYHLLSKLGPKPLTQLYRIKVFLVHRLFTQTPFEVKFYGGLVTGFPVEKTFREPKVTVDSLPQGLWDAPVYVSNDE